MLRVYDKPIKVNKSAKDRMEQDVGANLFVGNLDPEVDEKYLYDTFSAFGVVTRTPKVMRDPDTGESRGFGFVSFATFEASDAAIEAMNGQFLSNRPVSVMYAYKKDSRGERHGTPAERLLAQRNRSMREEKRPHTLFAAGPGQAPQGLGMGMPPGVSRMPPPPPPAGMAGAFRGMPPPPPPPHMMMYNGGGPPPGMMGQGMPPPPPPPGMMGQGMPPPPPPPGMMGQGMPPPPPPPGMMGQGMPPPPPPPGMMGQGMPPPPPPPGMMGQGMPPPPPPPEM